MLRLQRKAQSMSMNMIIVAVIALIVLVVVLVIFGGKAGFFSRNIDACKERNGICASTADQCPSATTTPIRNDNGFSDCQKGQVYCCFRVLNDPVIPSGG